MAEGSTRPCYTGVEVLNLLDIDGDDGGFAEYCFEGSDDEFEDIIDEIYDHDEIDR